MHTSSITRTNSPVGRRGTVSTAISYFRGEEALAVAEVFAEEVFDAPEAAGGDGGGLGGGCGGGHGACNC